MDRLSALSRGAQIMLAAGALLLITLFLPWQSIDLPEPFGSVSRSGWHGFWGVVLGLLVIVLLAWLVVRIAAVDIPLPVSSAMTAALLGTLILFFAVIKNLVDDYSTIWSYIGVVLAFGVAWGAWMQIQEAGGVDTLKTEAGSMRPATTGAEGTTAAGTTAAGTTVTGPDEPAPTPPPPAETSPPPAPEAAASEPAPPADLPDTPDTPDATPDTPAAPPPDEPRAS